MCCPSQPSGTRPTIRLDRVRRITTAVAMAFALLVTMSAATPGFAQSPLPSPTPT
ncbi:autotransporter domain-containing protein, partial [Bradyrhizobium hipponense]